MANDINFKLSLDGKEFIATAGISEDAIKKIASSIKQMENSGGDSFTNLSAKWGNIVTGFNQGLQVFEQFLSVASKPLVVAGQFEKYETQLRVMLGSASAAKARLKELSDFAAVTPFELPQVVAAANQLQALGRFSIETMRQLGDLAAASGKPMEQVLSAYAKLTSGQKGIAIDMFRDLLITTDDWAKATGAKIKNGEVLASTEDMARALPKILKERGFDGMMAEQSKTMEGMVSNMNDASTRLQAAIGQAFIEPTKEGIAGLTQTIADMNNIVNGLVAAWKGMTDVPDWLNTVGKSVLFVSTPVIALISYTKEVIHWLGELLKTEPPTDPYKKQIDAFSANVEKRKKLKAELTKLEVEEADKSAKKQADIDKKITENGKKTQDDMIEANRRTLEAQQQAWFDAEQDEVNVEAEALKKSRENNEQWAADVLRIRREKQDEERLASAQKMQEDPGTLRAKEAWDSFLSGMAQSIDRVADGLAGGLTTAITGGKVKWKQLIKQMEMMLLQSAIKGIIMSFFNIATGGGSGIIGKIFGFAGGGEINHPQVILAGEKGPEIIAPKANFNQVIRSLISEASAGTIAPRLPAGASGGGGNQAIIQELKMLRATLEMKEMSPVFGGELANEAVFKKMRLETNKVGMTKL